MEETQNSTIVYRTTYDAANELAEQDEGLAFKFIMSAIEYGLDGSYDESNPVINSLMQQVKFGLDRARERREKNVSDGQKGGRKVKYPPEEIRRLMTEEGLNKHEVAARMGCSIRTVERAMC